MSTNAVIAYDRASNGQWRGSSIHYDGYPSHLGRTILRLCQERFGYDIELLASYLVHQHSEWAALYFPPDERHASRCYCHGDSPTAALTEPRLEPRDLQGASWAEWLYIITPDHLEVIDHRGGRETSLGTIAWNQRNDDRFWNAFECGEYFERCQHLAAYHFQEASGEGGNLSTRKYLGLDPLCPLDDAIAYVKSGQEMQALPTRMTGGQLEREDGYYCIVVGSDGETHPLRIADAPGGTLAEGIEALMPVVASAALAR